MHVRLDMKLSGQLIHQKQRKWKHSNKERGEANSITEEDKLTVVLGRRLPVVCVVNEVFFFQKDFLFENIYFERKISTLISFL